MELFERALPRPGGQRAGPPGRRLGLALAVSSFLALGVGSTGAGGAGVVAATGPVEAAPQGPGPGGQGLVGTWGPLAPVSYGDAQLELPTSWPVVQPGDSVCTPNPAPSGVVLLGRFGSSSWCPPSDGQVARSPLNLVRLGPLPAGASNYRSLPKIVRHGTALYVEVLHGHDPGTVYLAPSLGAELMLSGPDGDRALAGLGPSARQMVLAHGEAGVPPTTWRRLRFAGLSVAVPRGWALTRTNFAYDCALQADAVALASPPTVVLDTSSNGEALPCPYMMAPRVAANGLVVDEASSAGPNAMPARGLALSLHGLAAVVDLTQPLSVLVVDVRVPGRSRPVQLHIGLGSAAVAQSVLSSVGPA